MNESLNMCQLEWIYHIKNDRGSIKIRITIWVAVSMCQMEFTHHIHYDKDSGYGVPPEEDA